MQCIEILLEKKDMKHLCLENALQMQIDAIQNSGGPCISTKWEEFRPDPKSKMLASPGRNRNLALLVLNWFPIILFCIPTNVAWHKNSGFRFQQHEVKPGETTNNRHIVYGNSDTNIWVIDWLIQPTVHWTTLWVSMTTHCMIWNDIIGAGLHLPKRNHCCMAGSSTRYIGWAMCSLFCLNQGPLRIYV